MSNGTGIIVSAETEETTMQDSKLRDAIRDTVARAAAPIMARTGFRFSKDYRRGASRFHRAVYAVCNTVVANFAADCIDCPFID